MASSFLDSSTSKVLEHFKAAGGLVNVLMLIAAFVAGVAVGTLGTLYALLQDTMNIDDSAFDDRER